MSRSNLVRPIAIALTVVVVGLAGCSSLPSDNAPDLSAASELAFSPVY